MTNIPNIKNVFLLVILLLLCAFGFFLAATIYHYEFFYHLAAIFIEIALSLAIIEVYLARGKAKESFRIYTLARNYIFQNLFLQFNKIFTQSLQGEKFLDKLGNKPSFHKSLVKQNFFRSLAIQITNEMSREDILEILDIVSKNLGYIERFSNSNIVYHNEDLFASLTNFLDLAYTISLLNSENLTKNELIEAFQNNTSLLGLRRSVRELYIQLIAQWLYIINNFIYFTETPSSDVRRVFIMTNAATNKLNFTGHLF